MTGRLLLTAVGSLMLGTTAQAQVAAHRVRFLTVAPDVRLEVLDWGGSGPALVFLAGFGNTGHVFDGFAPQFTDHHHVVAITRRGFGESSHPNAGYDTATLAQDITAVMDSLGIRRAAFVGHSFAGTELAALGAFHADRVTRLVFLDASYDFARLYADSGWQRSFPVPRPSAPTTSAIADWRHWFGLVMGPGVPDDEIRFMTSSEGPDLAATLQRGASASAFERIRAPVLALWAAPRSVEDQYPYWRSLDATARARLRASFDTQQAVRSAHLDAFRVRVPAARVVTVAGARHYLFLSDGRDVTRAMRAFLDASP